MPLSQSNDIVIRNIVMKCNNFFDVGSSEKYVLKNFTFENIQVSDKKNSFNPSLIENAVVKNVEINAERLKL